MCSYLCPKLNLDTWMDGPELNAWKIQGTYILEYVQKNFSVIPLINGKEKAADLDSEMAIEEYYKVLK